MTQERVFKAANRGERGDEIVGRVFVIGERGDEIVGRIFVILTYFTNNNPHLLKKRNYTAPTRKYRQSERVRKYTLTLPICSTNRQILRYRAAIEELLRHRLEALTPQVFTRSACLLDLYIRLFVCLFVM